MSKEDLEKLKAEVKANKEHMLQVVFVHLESSMLFTHDEGTNSGLSNFSIRA